MKVLLTRRWPEAAQAALAARFETQLSGDDRPLSPEALRAALGEYDVLCPTVSDRLPAALWDGAAPQVKLIANYGVGFEHIDLDACRARGVMVTNTPDVLTHATAELALTLLLMVARRAIEGWDEAREGRWTGWSPTHLMGLGLEGKVLGLVGYGKIAQAFARKAALALGMKIACHARRPISPSADGIEVVQAPSLEALLAMSDVVSLHVPGGAETRNLIDARALAAMKRGSVLINTARGTVVDHAALIAALKAGHLAGAGLDVFPAEPTIPEGLIGLPGVVVLPHLGSATLETRTAMGLRVLANVEAFARGEEPPDRVC